jgi:hypothetical protein
MADAPRLLVVTGGHPFDAGAFAALWAALPCRAEIVKHPAAAAYLSPEGAAGYDAIVFHDLPGLRFRADRPPEVLQPSAALRAGFAGLLAAGKPMLFLHHAIAGWPGWDDYAAAIGARFLYTPGAYRGQALPVSGYAGPVAYEARVLTEHPVTSGLKEGLSLCDELYLFQLIEADNLPLLAANYDFSDICFHSAAAALRGAPDDRTGWAHPPGCPLIAWARAAGRAPVVVIQPGDRAETLADAGYRRLVGNALAWLAAPEAAAWAARKHEGTA